MCSDWNANAISWYNERAKEAGKAKSMPEMRLISEEEFEIYIVCAHIASFVIDKWVLRDVNTYSALFPLCFCCVLLLLNNDDNSYSMNGVQQNTSLSGFLSVWLFDCVVLALLGYQISIEIWSFDLESIALLSPADTNFCAPTKATVKKVSWICEIIVRIHFRLTSENLPHDPLQSHSKPCILRCVICISRCLPDDWNWIKTRGRELSVLWPDANSLVRIGISLFKFPSTKR